MNALVRTALAVKALPALVGAAWKSAFTLSSAPLYEWSASLHIAWGTAEYTKLAAKVKANPYASACIRLVAQAVRSVQIYAVPANDPQGAALPKSRALAVLRTAGPDVLDRIVAHLYIGGAFYLRLRGPDTGPNAGRPTKVSLIRPDRIAAATHDRETGEVATYRVSRKDGRQETVPASEIYAALLYDPTDDDAGAARMESAWRSLVAMENADTWEAMLSTTGGRMPTMWRPTGENRVTIDQVREAEAMHDTRVRERLGKDHYTTGNYEPVVNTIRPKDAEIALTTREHVRRICAAGGVDPALVGDASNRTYSNMQEARAGLYEDTGLPLLGDVILLHINAAIGEPYGELLTFDAAKIGALSEDTTERYNRVSVAYEKGLITQGEGRVEMGFSATPEDADTTTFRLPPTPSAGPLRLPDAEVIRPGIGDGASVRSVVLPQPGSAFEALREAYGAAADDILGGA